ncbi:hypothetical protein ABFS82_10G115900 [Erythranthe guttata]
MIYFFDRPVRRPAWLYSYMFRLAGHYGYSGMASQRGGVLLKKMDRWEPHINIAEWPTKPRIIARESKVSKDRRISNSPRSGKKRSKGRRSSSSIPQMTLFTNPQLLNLLQLALQGATELPDSLLSE